MHTDSTTKILVLICIGWVLWTIHQDLRDIVVQLHAIQQERK